MHSDVGKKLHTRTDRKRKSFESMNDDKTIFSFLFLFRLLRMLSNFLFHLKLYSWCPGNSIFMNNMKIITIYHVITEAEMLCAWSFTNNMTACDNHNKQTEKCIWHLQSNDDEKSKWEELKLASSFSNLICIFSSFSFPFSMKMKKRRKNFHMLQIHVLLSFQRDLGS